MWRMPGKGIGPILLVASMVAIAHPGWPQSITGDILGTVHDPSGAVVPGAKVSLTAVDTGITFEATSNSSGNYLFAQLKPGHYSVQASKEGFETATVSNI